MEEMTMMKALVRHKFGGPDVMRIEEVERPALEDDRVLVRVRASSINKADLHTLVGTPRIVRPISGNGFFRPKTPLFGSDMAGVVEAVGKDVTGLAPGDEVFGARSGAYAEYVSAKFVVKKPVNVSFEEAGTIGIAGLTALQGLKEKGKLQPGERVLINGASGGVGTMAIQVAKALGGNVTAVVGPRNVEQARELGADRVIDRTQDNFTRGSERYDLVLDVAGGHSWSALRRALSPSGRVVLVGGHAHRAMLWHLAGVFLASRIRRGGKLIFFVTKFNNPDLQILADMMESGQLKPAIDRTYPLSEAKDAFRTYEEGHVRGKLVLVI
jgi:NADPH:quinone reductase-like Zn-dependent oxidoreductase